MSPLSGASRFHVVAWGVKRALTVGLVCWIIHRCKGSLPQIKLKCLNCIPRLREIGIIEWIRCVRPAYLAWAKRTHLSLRLKNKFWGESQYPWRALCSHFQYVRSYSANSSHWTGISKFNGDNGPQGGRGQGQHVSIRDKVDLVTVMDSRVKVVIWIVWFAETYALITVSLERRK